MPQSHHEVNLGCPVCKKTSQIKIPLEVFEKSTSKVITIHIDKMESCLHHFLLFIERTSKKIIGNQKLDIYKEEMENIEDNPVNDINELINEYGENTFNHIIHAMLLKIPIILIHNLEEKINRAKIFNQMFYSILPQTIYRNFIPCFPIFNQSDIKKLGLNGLVILADKNLEVIPWEEVTFEIINFLIRKASEFLDPLSQQKVMGNELEKLVPIMEWVKKQNDNWGSISADEIQDKFQIFGNIISTEKFMMEFIQIMKYTNITDYKTILITKKKKHILHFYEKLLKT